MHWSLGDINAICVVVKESQSMTIHYYVVTVYYYLFINFTLISGYKGVFKWFDYLKHTKSVAAPVKLFDKVCSCL